MIGFRVDGNFQIGMGHYIRCSGIARSLEASGNGVLFIPSKDSDPSYLRKNGFKYKQLKKDGLIGWNAEEVCEIIEENRISVLLVDSYRISNESFCLLKQYCKVVYLDDLDFYGCDVDVVVNFNIGADRKKYLEYTFLAREVYTGISYYPLRKEFNGKRKKNINKQVRSVLITSGSTDPVRCVYQIMQAIGPLSYPEIEFRLLIGLFYSEKYKNELLSEMSVYPNVKIILWSADISDELASVDLLISSGSSTVIEALSLNVPCITYQFADNHHIECIQLQQLLFADWAGEYLEGQENEITNMKMRELFDSELCFEKRVRQSKRFSTLFDGKGLQKIVEIIDKIGR